MSMDLFYFLLILNVSIFNLWCNYVKRKDTKRYAYDFAFWLCGFIFLLVVFLGCGLIFSFFALSYLAEIKGERLQTFN
jgi:hypothetical protein